MGLVATEDRGSVRHIVMTRAEKRNAMNGDMVRALGEAFQDAAIDNSVHVVVVRGDGPMFSSGMDVSALADLSDEPENLRPFRAGSSTPGTCSRRWRSRRSARSTAAASAAPWSLRSRATCA